MCGSSICTASNMSVDCRHTNHKYVRSSAERYTRLEIKTASIF